MQTFLPYKSFRRSAACLDYHRLGKQRVEAWQIYHALTEPGYSWQNHPAVKMWRGHEGRLLEYGKDMCTEWLLRGYSDSMLPRFVSQVPLIRDPSQWRMPAWLTDEFCRAHRSNLLRKEPRYYRKFGWCVPANLPYIWPINDKGELK